MPFYQLHLDAEFDQLSAVGFAPSVQPTLKCKIACTGCRGENKNVLVSLEDAYEDEDAKTTIHWSATCKCKAGLKVWIKPIPALVKDGTIKKTKLMPDFPALNEYYNQIGTKTNNTLFCVIECRGAEVLGWEVVNTEFHASNEAGEMFKVGDLSTDGFYDVDSNNESVSVTLVGYRVVRC